MEIEIKNKIRKLFSKVVRNAPLSLIRNIWERSGSVVESAWLETEGPRVRASPASLCCVLEQEH